MVALPWYGLLILCTVVWLLGRAAGVSAGALQAMQGPPHGKPPPEMLAALLGKMGAPTGGPPNSGQ